MAKVDIGQIDVLQLAATSTTLGGGAVYTGDIFKVAGFTKIAGMVYSDQSSAANGFVVEQAADEDDFALGFVFRTTVSYTGAAVTGNIIQANIVAPFARITYTNGATPQASFRLCVAAKTMGN